MVEEMHRQDLEKEGYSLQAVLYHSDLPNFIKPYFFKWNFTMIFYRLFFILLLIYIIYALRQTDAFGHYLFHVLIGIVLFVFIIPVHELIHGIAYRLFGAKNVTYKAEWKKFIFYAMADGFITKKIPFVVLAIAPFVLLNSILILSLFLLPSSYYFVLLGLLLMHSAGCSGDFALVSYFQTFWEKDPITFDDVKMKVSYFYIKEDSK
jgi:Putative zincin peptidase